MQNKIIPGPKIVEGNFFFFVYMENGVDNFIHPTTNQTSHTTCDHINFTYIHTHTHTRIYTFY